MTFRLTLATCLLAVSPALAQRAPQSAPPPKTAPAGNAAAPAAPIDDFDKEVDALFVEGGLTADQAAARAAKVSPNVIRSAAEVDVAIAQRQTAELARVPQIGGTASYTRLSKIDPLMFGPDFPPLTFPSNSYLFEGSIGVPLSEYIWRFPKLIDAAKLGESAARANHRTSEVNASHEARLAYFEWLRSRLQVLIAERQLEQVRTTLKQVRALAEVQRLSKADLMRVEAEEADPGSMLSFYRSLLAFRRGHRVWGTGTSRLLPTDDRAIVAFVRENEEASYLVAVNLASEPRRGTAQSTVLAALAGLVPAAVKLAVPWLVTAAVVQIALGVGMRVAGRASAFAPAAAAVPAALVMMTASLVATLAVAMAALMRGAL